MRISDWSSDVCSSDLAAQKFFRAAPGGIPTTVAFSQDATFLTPDLDRQGGCIRSKEHAYSKDGGLAVLYGNLAPKGCIVKTAGVDESQWVFTGRARVFESQDDAVEGILVDQIVARSEERRAGKECVSTCRARGSPCH